jgi:hypothetical protein
MRALKIVFGIVAAIWVVALVPVVFGDYTDRVDLAVSYHTGAAIGIIIAASISVSLFRSVRLN